MSKDKAIVELKKAIKQQIDLTKQAEKTSSFNLRPIVEKMNRTNISALLAIVEALEGGE
jgi:hypothetical protein